MNASPLRSLLPKEHGLNAWVLVPLFAAILQAPAISTGLSALAVFAGFGAFNAARRGVSRVAAFAAALASLLGVAALGVAARPAPLLAVFAVALVGALVAILRFGRALPRSTAPEIAAIVALNALGAGIAVAGGASVGRASALGAVLATWEVTGLWWVRRALAPLLPGRVPWAAGPAVATLCAVLTLILAWRLGHPEVAAVLALLPLRLWLDPAPRSAREAPRVGFTELGWALLATVLGVVV